jgi:hypothetical protein
VPVVNVAEVTVPAPLKFTVPVVVTDRAAKEPSVPPKVTAPVPAFKLKFCVPLTFPKPMLPPAEVRTVLVPKVTV